MELEKTKNQLDRHETRAIVNSKVEVWESCPDIRAVVNVILDASKTGKD